MAKKGTASGSKRQSAKNAPVKNELSNDPVPREIQNEASRMLHNGLSEAIMGFDLGSSGTPLSQVDTLFKNNRWYLVSNMRQILSEIYVEHGLVQTIVDVPVDDALRGGIEIQSKQADPEEIEEIITEMEEKDDLNNVGQALKWNRLYGGAGILILTDQDPKEPLNRDSLENARLEFRAVDMWELYFNQQNVDGDGTPIEAEPEFYNYYGKKIHKSRVKVLKGLAAPSFVRPRLRGWGFSVVEALVRSINQYLKANNLCFEVLDEFKIDVYKIKGLASTLLSADGTQQVAKRVRLANWQKNYQSAVTMDSDDDYLQKELSFTGLAETMSGIRMQIAADMRMPLTKVFGISSAGFNSGEDDIENYNGMIESQVRAKCKPAILELVKLRFQQKFGYVPDDLRISFKPLRVLSTEQEENVKTQKFNRLLSARQAGEIDALEFRDGCNKDNLLSIQLDTDDETLAEIEEENSALDESQDGGEGKDDEKEVPAKKAPAGATKAKESPEAKT